MNTFDDDVSIDRFEMIEYGHKVIATLNLVIGGCRFEVGLSVGGHLRFPDGVRISDEVKWRATELVRQAAMTELTRKWFGKPRGSGTVHRIRAVDASEEATRG